VNLQKKSDGHRRKLLRHIAWWPQEKTVYVPGTFIGSIDFLEDDAAVYAGFIQWARTST